MSSGKAIREMMRETLSLFAFARAGEKGERD